LRAFTMKHVDLRRRSIQEHAENHLWRKSSLFYVVTYRMLVVVYGRFSKVRQALLKRRQSNNISYVTTQPIEDLIYTAAEARGVAYLRRTFVSYTALTINNFIKLWNKVWVDSVVGMATATTYKQQYKNSGMKQTLRRSRGGLTNDLYGHYRNCEQVCRLIKASTVALKMSDCSEEGYQNWDRK
jgi:hypothetical protein